MELKLGKCLGCDIDLEEVFDGSSKMHQFKDAIDLTFMGGYGEKIDGNQAIRFSLCDLCSDRFFNLFPGILEYFLEFSLVDMPADIEAMRNAKQN